jgi:hypothetical protein
MLAQRAASEGPPRNWDHFSHPLVVLDRCGLVWDKARLGAPGLGG